MLGGGIALLGAGIAGCSIAPDRDPVNSVPVAEPVIISADEWGAMSPQGPPEVVHRRPDLIVIHHTAGPNTDDLSQEHAEELARSIQRFHMESQGWSDSGQHFTVSRGGSVLEGRVGSLDASRTGSEFVQGSHAYGANDASVGIENEGTYNTEEMPAAQWDALVALTAWLCTQHRVQPSGIVGHRDVTNTDCPGDWLYGRVARLRRDVAAVLHGG